jgi:hypothetical protein
MDGALFVVAIVLGMVVQVIVWINEAGSKRK